MAISASFTVGATAMSAGSTPIFPRKPDGLPTRARDGNRRSGDTGKRHRQFAGGQQAPSAARACEARRGADRAPRAGDLRGPAGARAPQHHRHRQRHGAAAWPAARPAAALRPVRPARAADRLRGDRQPAGRPHFHAVDAGQRRRRPPEGAGPHLAAAARQGDVRQAARHRAQRRALRPPQRPRREPRRLAPPQGGGRWRAAAVLLHRESPHLAEKIPPPACLRPGATAGWSRLPACAGMVAILALVDDIAHPTVFTFAPSGAAPFALRKQGAPMADHPPFTARRIIVGAALTAVGGFVDCFSYLTLSRVYTATMSGNTVLIAVHGG